VRVGTTDNLVVNGGFEDPVVSDPIGFKIYGAPGIKGWTTDEIEIGLGSIYNPGWTSQVC
jgi:hypothetical protein